MAKLKHTDLFDFTSYNQALKEIDASTREFGNSVSEVIKRVAGDQKGLTAEMKAYVDTLKNFNVAKPNAGAGLKNISKEVDELIGRNNELKAVQQGLASIVDIQAASVKELKAEYSGLRKQYENLKPEQAGYAEQVKIIMDRVRQVVPAITSFNVAVKAQKSAIDAAEGSYKKMALELADWKNKLQSLPNAFDLVTGKLNKNNKEAVEASNNIQRLDATLKAADAHMGVYARNVGNYASHWNGLGNAINQLTREAPAFAVSLQTGILALSNNIPILTDEIGKLKKANAELVAQGEKPKSILKQIGASILSFGTLLSLGVTLLTIYAKEIGEWVSSLFKGAEAVDKVKIAQDNLDKALASTEYTTAIKNVNELTNNIQLAKEGLISKEAVVKQYNDTIGKATGFVKSLDDAEAELVKSGGAYIQMTLQKAVANLALEEAAKKAFEAEQKRRKDAETFLTTGDDVLNALSTAGSTDFGDAARNREAAEKARKEQSEKRKRDAIKQSEDEQKVYEDIAKNAQRKAAEIAKKYGLSIFDQTSGEDAAKKAQDRVRQLQDLLKQELDLNIKQEELKLAKNEITEQQYQDKKLALTLAYVNKAIDAELSLRKDANKKVIASLRQVSVEAQIEYQKAGADRDQRIKNALQRTLSSTSGGLTTGTVGNVEDIKKDNDKRAKENADRLEKQYQTEVTAENRQYELIRARRDATFSDEQKHLKRLKDLRVKYGKDTAEAEHAIKLSAAQQQQEIDKQTVQVMIEAGRQAIAGFQDILRQQSDNRISELETERDRELAAAGNNANAREAIEKKFNERIRQEKIKQAKQDKIFAAFQIGINTALAISKVLAEVPKFDFGVSTAALIAAYSALGAIQLAAVLAKPLPKFKKGTQNAPKGFAIVNEAGPEIIEKNGRMRVAQGNLTYLEGGEKIHTHDQSKRIAKEFLRQEEINRLMQMTSLHGKLTADVRKSSQEAEVAKMAEAMRRGGINETTMRAIMKDAVRDIPRDIHSWDDRGYRHAQQRKNELRTYLNQKYGG